MKEVERGVPAPVMVYCVKMERDYPAQEWWSGGVVDEWMGWMGGMALELGGE